MENKGIFLRYGIFVLSYLLLNFIGQQWLPGVLICAPYLYLVAAIIFWGYFGTAGQKGKEKEQFFHDFKWQVLFLAWLVAGFFFGFILVRKLSYLFDCFFLALFYFCFLAAELLLYFIMGFYQEKKYIRAGILLFVLFGMGFFAVGILYMCLMQGVLLKIHNV